MSRLYVKELVCINIKMKDIVPEIWGASSIA